MTMIVRMMLFLSMSILNFGLEAQGKDFQTDDILQGYTVQGDSTIFLFDPEVYGVNPNKVVVTGSFRGWDQSMTDPTWSLKRTSHIYSLSIFNPEFDVIAPNAEFKFRIDDGEWLSPPEESTNEKGSNLVFMKSDIKKQLKAEILDNHTIWADIIGDRPLNKDGYVLTDVSGNRIPIATILPNTLRETLIKTAVEIDRRRVYFLEIPSIDLKTFCSYDGWFRTLYSSKPLGANISEDRTDIRLFAPRAEEVIVYLYKDRTGDDPYETHSMRVDQDGVWEVNIEEDLHGIYYDFTVHGSDDPGNHFFDKEKVHLTDPYARVSDNTWGRCRIWRNTQPATPLASGIPPMQDVIAYEVHIQDFTDNLPVNDNIKGRFEGMMVKGLTNSRGEKIGFDYLLDLGINTVHLMPVQEYLHFPDDDWKESFQNDPYMIDQGVSEENYQWGYRTSHFMAIESKYRTKGKEPGAEREEFRDLVQAFHDHGLAVIIDIVPNHTAENMDGNAWIFNFNGIDKMYYYRTKDFDHIGAYGNEVKTENRPMVQRWLIDQCRHFIDEFGIDGFRIDLAGQIDQQTLKKLKDAIGHDKILYGEAWIGSNDPAYEENPDWDWYKEDSPITYFQDDSRNAYKGPVFELNDKFKDRGWPGGKYDERENVMAGLINKCKDDITPLSGITYLDIHDNFALADQFATRDFDGRLAVDQNLYKIAVTLLYTSLGPIVTHGGSEIMRSKASAPLREVVKKTKAGYSIYMHGKRDTYNHRKANQFIWENVGAEPEGENENDYANMHAFWQGMNKFRSSDYGKVFRVAESVPDEYYQWILPDQKSALGYIVDKQILVLLNPGGDWVSFKDFELPDGQWIKIANVKEVDLDGVDKLEELHELRGDQRHSIHVSPEDLGIWVKIKR